MIWACVNTREFRVLHGFTFAEIMLLGDRIVAKQPDDRPIEQLIADLESEAGERRRAATDEIFRRGKAVLPELKSAGARQVSPAGGSLNTRRLDMIYSLIEGLADNPSGATAGYRTDSVGLHLEPGATPEDVERIGTNCGFTLAAEFSNDARPNCYVVLDDGKALAEVLESLLRTEPAVVTVNLNYFEP
jgi:hypothetical protein